MESNESKYTLIGLFASLLLLAFYVMVSSILGGLSFALSNFAQLWYWMVPLIIGFGVQIGMFFYARDEMHKKATAQAVASTGISTTSMIACCAHHLADIAPFLGITALGLFLIKYQSTLLLLGVLSNLLGIAYMASLITAKAPKANMKAVFYSLLVLSILVVSASYWYASKGSINFETITSNKNNVEFQVTPLSASEFQIAINTHSVALDFDLTKISALYDNIGNLYKPVKWEGSPPGSHHRSGTLKFPSVSGNAKSIKLVITDSAAREFSWNIK